MRRLLVYIFCATIVISAKVIYVDQSITGTSNGTSWSKAYKTLQDALDNASADDQIWVAAGTYNPTYDYGINLGAKGRHFRLINGVRIYGGFTGSETLISERDFIANETILSGDLGTLGDPSDNSYCVLYHPEGSNLDTTAVLDGFTVRDGVNWRDFPDNQGAGIFNYFSSPKISNCKIISNKAYLDSAKGGGVCNYYSQAVFENCTISGNFSEYYGAGVYNFSSDTHFTNCIVEDNSIVETYLRDTFGGGIYAFDSNLIIENSLISSNTAVYGGGIYCEMGSLKISNCTIADNLSEVGGGLYIKNFSDCTINNSIIWSNEATEGASQLYVFGNSSIALNYSCFRNRINDITGSIYVAYDSTSVNENPRFINTGISDYRIFGNSPCKDAGNSVYNTLTVDLRGQQRVQDSEIDMGAYEWTDGIDSSLYSPKTIYVKQDAAGSNDGTTWMNAFTDLQPALNIADESDQIWIAGGEYYPSYSYDLFNTPRNYHFRLKYDLSVYGGFEGTETEINQREIEHNPTILSGDIGVKKDNSDNCYHIFYHPEGVYLDNSAVIDGVIITCGNADGSYPNDCGGGMYNLFSAPALRNCTISDNNANSRGGGFFFSNSSDQFYYQLTNCLITRNTSVTGGGLYSVRGNASVFLKEKGEVSCSTITNCTIASNTAGKGGGVYFIDDISDSNSNTAFSNCIIYSNIATISGNQIYNSEDQISVVNSCISNGLNDIENDGGSFLLYQNNISYDPVFIDKQNNDYRIHMFSPCIDSGIDSLNSQQYDIRGFNFGRKLDTNGNIGSIDMGAYEWNFSTDPNTLVPPENVTVTHDQNEVVVSWDYSVSGVSFTVFRSELPYGDFAQIGITYENSFIDFEVLPGNKYFYYVVAVVE